MRDAGKQSIVIRAAFRRLIVGAQIRSEQVIGFKAGSHVLHQPEASHQQSRAYDKDYGTADFRDHQPPECPWTPRHGPA